MDITLLTSVYFSIYNRFMGIYLKNVIEWYKWIYKWNWLMNITGLLGYCMVDTFFSSWPVMKWKCRHFIWWYCNHWLNWKLSFSHHPTTANCEKWVNAVLTTVQLILYYYIHVDVKLLFPTYCDFAHNMFYPRFFIRNDKIKLYTQWHFHINASSRSVLCLVSGDGTD